MGGFGYQTVLQHLKGELPGVFLLRCKLNADEEAFTSNLFHSGAFENGFQAVEEFLPLFG